MNFVPLNNDNEADHNQAAPNLQALLQKIRRFRLPSDENLDKIFPIQDNVSLVDANPIKFPIFTKHNHYQLLNLCELSTDGEAMYFSSNGLALPESLVREAELSGHKKAITKEDLANVSRREYGALRKLFIKTGNLCIVERITLTSIFSISCAGGFVAVNNSSEVQVMHEATQKLVRGQFFTKKHINTVQLVPFKIGHDERVMLFVCKNDGEVTSYMIEEEDDKFVTRFHQQIIAPLNINFASIASFEFGKYLLCAADDAKGPVIYQMNQQGMFELLQDALCYTRKTSSTMCSWQAQGPYLAMATERGQCIVWHFPSKEIVRELGSSSVLVKTEDDSEDEESDTSFTFNSEACIRLVKFNPLPLFNYIMVFAEAKKNVHVVDTRTWEEQIIKVGDGDINGLCFSHDGKKLHVAHAEGIHVYDLILKKSLFESCVQYIHSNLHLKSQFNWQFDHLPREVQRKLDY